MKFLFIIVVILFIGLPSHSQNIGIGTNTPSSSAQLDVSSTSKGFLPPRMTIVQRNGILSPALGLVIFCTDCYELNIFDGFNWKNINGTAACTAATLPFIKICDQIWMPVNLNVTKYKNGDNIPQVTDPAVWASLTIGAWCWYNNDSATYAATYGRLYNWYAVNDPRGLAPEGWHVPSDTEWSTLSTCLGGDAVAGGKLKEAGLVHWLSPNTGATNSSGFGALPGSLRYNGGVFLQAGVGDAGYFWSSTETSPSNAWYRYLIFDNNYLFKYNPNLSKSFGASVRCLKD